MKKTFLIISMLLGGMLITPLEMSINASVVSICSQGTEVKTISFRGSGGVKAKSYGSATIEETSDGLKAWKNGKGPYRVYRSDNSDYKYMFSDGRFTYYFNY